MLSALVIIVLLAAVAGLLTNLRIDAPAASVAASSASLAERLDALLPQTQCRRCTFEGCRPYAEAMAAGEAGINQCPPGGAGTAAALADVLGVPAQPVDPSFGTVPDHAVVAFIEELPCIGCTKCIQACPVDAIIGAPRYMHTVIADQCTGCELCIPVCPVDCIVLKPAAGVVH